MGKTLKLICLILFSAFFLIGVAVDADAKKKKKKKIPKKPSYVGSVKCNGSCHDPYYQAWVDSPHGKTFDILKAGQRADAKKKDKLDPGKDYTADPQCLRCHTTGYRQKGGFKPAGSKSKKGKDTSSSVDPDEPNKDQVGCEMCHSAAGGAQFRVVMKNSKGDYKKSETEKYGQRWDYENVCSRCHGHPKSPHGKGKVDYAKNKATLHPIAKYFNEDNEDQNIVKDGKVKDRAKEKGMSEEKGLRIEDWDFKKGKLKFAKGTRPYSSKKKKFYYKK